MYIGLYINNLYSHILKNPELPVWYAGWNSFHPAYQTVIHTEWQIPSAA